MISHVLHAAREGVEITVGIAGMISPIVQTAAWGFEYRSVNCFLHGLETEFANLTRPKVSTQYYEYFLPSY